MSLLELYFSEFRDLEETASKTLSDGGGGLSQPLKKINALDGILLQLKELLKQINIEIRSHDGDLYCFIYLLFIWKRNEAYCISIAQSRRAYNERVESCKAFIGELEAEQSRRQRAALLGAPDSLTGVRQNTVTSSDKYI